MDVVLKCRGLEEEVYFRKSSRLEQGVGGGTNIKRTGGIIKVSGVGSHTTAAGRVVADLMWCCLLCLPSGTVLRNG